MRRLPLACLILAAVLPAQATLYRGTQAGRSLILGDEAQSYYYEDERLPYPLTATADDCPGGARCYRLHDNILLEQRGAHWRIRGGATLAPYTPPPDDDPANRLYAAELPYEAALLSDIHYTRQDSIAHDDKTLTHYQNPASGLSHYLIDGGDYPPAARDALNQYLRAQALASEYSRRECLARLPADKRPQAAAQYRVTIHATYTDPHYHSAHIHEQTPCGYSGHYGITYHIPQQRGLELEDLLWTGDGAPHLLDDNSPADQQQRETRAAWLLDALNTAAPDAMRAYPYQACDYQYPYYYLTPRGLYIGPLLPLSKTAHAHPADTILPYELVKAHPGLLGADALKNL